MNLRSSCCSPLSRVTRVLFVAARRAKSLVSEANEKLNDRIALADMKDRQKNAQAVDRAIASHRRMHKELAEARQTVSALLPHMKVRALLVCSVRSLFAPQHHASDWNNVLVAHTHTIGNYPHGVPMPTLPWWVRWSSLAQAQRQGLLQKSSDWPLRHSSRPCLPCSRCGEGSECCCVLAILPTVMRVRNALRTDTCVFGVCLSPGPRGE